MPVVASPFYIPSSMGTWILALVLPLARTGGQTCVVGTFPQQIGRLKTTGEIEWWLSLSTPEMNVKAMIANARHEFTAYAVSTLVNNPRNDDARLLEPV